ncbi:MAG: DUF4923 family protein [Muribaculaceae bacterium]|nr:DUF4923 family protein [Muribaculaceae bacterium]
MKKIYIPILACMAIMTTGCGSMAGLGGTTGGTNNGIGNVLGGVLGALGSQNTVNSLLDLVIGQTKISQSQIVGTWQYAAPGCAFTSENLLAKAGGAVAAGQVKEKLQSAYSGIGVKSSNTYFTFSADNKFQASVDGIPLSGTYVLNPEAGSIQLNATLLSLTGYVTPTTNGMALTFESKKLLTIVQAAAALTGNTAIKTIGDLSTKFDGVRVGFDMAKTK